MRQVQRMVASGALTQTGVVGRTSLIDATSVQRLKAQGARPGRPWSSETIAAAIDLLDHGASEQLDSVEQARLLKRLRLASPEEVVRAMRKRAQVQRYRASESFIERIFERVTLTGAAALNTEPALLLQFGLVAISRRKIDGYIELKNARRIIRSCHLVGDAQGNVTLRVTDIDALLKQELQAVVIALDLADSLDTRERKAGLAFLSKRLKALR